jgi:uncharacterized membrane protein YqjE
MVTRPNYIRVKLSMIANANLLHGIIAPLITIIILLLLFVYWHLLICICVVDYYRSNDMNRTTLLLEINYHLRRYLSQRICETS